MKPTADKGQEKQFDSFLESFSKQRDKLCERLSGCGNQCDMEEIHALRIASRRMQAHLRLADLVIGGRGLRKLSDRVDELQRRLGRLRDLQVRRQLVISYAGTDKPAVAEYLTDLMVRERRAFRRLRRFMRKNAGQRLCTLATRVHKKLAAVPYVEHRLQLIDAVKNNALNFRRKMRDIGPLDISAAHPARLALKRYRYALEACRTLLSNDGLDELLQHLQEVQHVLGDLHDRQVLLEDFDEFSVREGKHSSALQRKVQRDYQHGVARVLENCETWAALGGTRMLRGEIPRLHAGEPNESEAGSSELSAAQ